MKKYKVILNIRKVVEAEVYGLNEEQATERAYNPKEIDITETKSENIIDVVHIEPIGEKNE